MAGRFAQSASVAHAVVQIIGLLITDWGLGGAATHDNPARQSAAFWHGKAKSVG